MGKEKLAEIVAKLTAKQRKFAEGLVYGGLSKAEAYRQAYRWNGNGNAVRVSAVRNAQKPNVALAIKAMEEEKVAQWWENKHKLQSYVMNGLISTTDNTKSDMVKLKSLELLGRTRYASVFEEPQANESTTQLHDNISELIQSKLAMLLTLGDVTPTKLIDVTPSNLEFRDVTVPDGGGLTPEEVSTAPTGGGEGDEAG
jgi:hypothetical protein